MDNINVSWFTITISITLTIPYAATDRHPRIGRLHLPA